MKTLSLDQLARLASVLSCSLLLAAGCTKPAIDDQHADNRQVLNRGNGGEPGTLDPALASDIHAFNILVDLYEGLTAEAADGSLLPGVAESWHVSNDGLTYTFKLRDDARWSDGSPVLATDFVRSLRRAVSPATASPTGFLLQPLVGFDAVQSGDLPVSGLGVIATSGTTLEMTLSRPVAYWLSILSLPIACPTKTAGDGLALTNGAYKLLERNLDGVTRLTKNQNYWSADSVAVNQVAYHAIVEPVAEYNMYRTGELDITHNVPSEYVTDLRKERPDELRIAPSLAFYYLAFDLTEAPLDELSLRAALSLAIDRQVVATVIGRGEQPAYGVVPPGVREYRNASYEWQDTPPAERIRLAQGYYADAGYGPDKPLQLELTYDVGDIHEKVALAVASMWTDVLGVEVALEKIEWQLLLDTRDQRAKWQVMRFAWFGDYNAAETFLEIFESNSLQNLSKYQSPQFDKLLDAARKEPDMKKSAALMREAEQHLLSEYPIAPLYFFVSKHLVRPDISGFEENVLDRHPSRFIRFDGSPTGRAISRRARPHN